MNTEELKQFINELIEEVLEETSTTASVGGAYNTPFAFGNANIKTYTQDGFKKVSPSKKSKVFDRKKFGSKMKQEQINEISYHRFNKDVTRITPERKLTRALNEVRKRIKEIEQVIEYSNRLKTENIIKKESFWSSKMGQLENLSERLQVLSNNIKKLHK